MLDQVPEAPATTARWPDLVAEFDRWGEAGRIAGLWWRDDDAVDATPQLEQLLHLASGIPLALAVIPALARPALTTAVASSLPVAVLQHGWRHVDHAGGGKKSEYPATRPVPEVVAELAAGQARLRSLFGPRALPVLVPPWNRIADELLPALPSVGIAMLSATVPRRRAPGRPGLARLDIHVDLVDWHGGRGFIGTEEALSGLVRHLRARRQGEEAGPVGILTHHLVMDDRAATFLKQLTALVERHHAVRWVGVNEALQ